MKRRPRRGGAASLTALVVFAVAAVVAVVAVQMIVGDRPWLDYDRIVGTLHGTRWRDQAVLITASAVAAVGLVLLLAAVIPGRLIVLPLRDNTDELTSGASRRSLRSTLRAAAAGVDGVQTAKVHFGQRRLRVVVRTNRTTTTGLADAVHTAVGHRLDQIVPATRPDVRVRVQALRGKDEETS